MTTAPQLEQNPVDSPGDVQQESVEDLKELMEAVSSVEQIELSEEEITKIVGQ
jgi:hypothetical protein